MTKEHRLPDDQHTSLKRVLGLPLLTLYGLGVIIGAGIYVLVGEIAGQAGMDAPLAFLISAAIAALTGLSYGELAARYPEAAGEVAYARHAFGSDAFARVVGLGVLLVVVVAAASIARGAAGYIQVYLEVPDWLAAGALVVVLTGVACLNVRQSVGLAALFSLIEIGGLLFVVYAGAGHLIESRADLPPLVPVSGAGWTGLMGGAFVAFFAYLGFENIVNMAEETRRPSWTVPRAILLSILLSGLIYAVVAWVAVMAVSPDRLAEAKAPLCLVVEQRGFDCRTAFSPVALFAISNGVMLEIILIARLCYGMARRGLAPAILGRVSPVTRVPVIATLIGGGIVAVFTIALPFSILVTTTNIILLAVFMAVNASLWRLKRQDLRAGKKVRPEFSVPRWVPATGFLVASALIVVGFAG